MSGLTEARDLLYVAAGLFGAFSCTASLAWWLRGQFFDLKETFTSAMTRHEQEDTERFDQLNIRLMKLEIAQDNEGRNIAQHYERFSTSER